MDFLVSDLAGYRDLRQLLTGVNGLAPITRLGAMPLVLDREVRADQYGIRTRVLMDGHAIKFEIVREARIALLRPAPQELICGISTDLAPEKRTP